MKTTKFKGGLSRQFKEGKIGMSVHTGISYKRPKKKKPKTKWEKINEWVLNLFSNAKKNS